MRGWAPTIVTLLAAGCSPVALGSGAPGEACLPPESSRLGFNAYHLVRAELGTAEGDVDAALVEATLVGAGALRIWAFDESRPPQWHVALSEVLNDIAGAGLGVVASLSNLWSDYGGVPGYLRRSGRDPVLLRDFFVEPELEEAWRSDVRDVVERHVDRDGIIAWELMNEPRCPGCDPAVLAEWLLRQRRFVRSLDPDTPIWDGDEGWARGDGWGMNSVGALHVYPRREANASAADSIAHGRRRIALAASRAQQAGVPWVLGEVGWPYRGCDAADPDCTRTEEHIESNDAEKAVAFGALLTEAVRQRVDRVFVWRLAEPEARDWDHMAVTPSTMPRVRRALCEAAHLLGPR
jgi:endo-1,4-beta-mannosidase